MSNWSDTRNGNLKGLFQGLALKSSILSVSFSFFFFFALMYGYQSGCMKIGQLFLLNTSALPYELQDVRCYLSIVSNRNNPLSIA